MRNAERGVRNDFIPLTLHSQGKVHTTNYLDFEIWMQYATKVKPQRVAVLAVLRPEGVLLLTKYSAKIQSPNRREFTQQVNDRKWLLFYEVIRPKYHCYIVYLRSLHMLDFFKTR